MSITSWGYAGAAGVSVAAGAINSVAGGGTLICFPTLVALGLPPVTSNVTNTVSLLPGYISGSYAQRDHLRPQLARAKGLAVVCALGGLVGSILLVVLPSHAFRVAVPYLIVVACTMLFAQDRLRRMVAGGAPTEGHRPPMIGLLLVASMYGGFFGAGLGIVLLAVLGLFSTDSLTRVNALKQALQFVVNLVAAVFFLTSGHVYWPVVPAMAAGSIVGGVLGGRLVGVVPERLLRLSVVVVGLAVAIGFWVG